TRTAWAGGPTPGPGSRHDARPGQWSADLLPVRDWVVEPRCLYPGWEVLHEREHSRHGAAWHAPAPAIRAGQRVSSYNHRPRPPNRRLCRSRLLWPSASLQAWWPCYPPGAADDTPLTHPFLAA